MLYRSLEPEKVTYSEILKNLSERLKDEKFPLEHQHPIVLGSNNYDDVIFLHQNQNYYLKIFDLVDRKNFSLYTYPMLQKLYRKLKENIGVPFAKAYYTLGYAFLEKGEYENAYEVLQIAMSASKEHNPKILYSLAISYLQKRKYQESLSSIEQYIQLYPESIQSLEDIIKKIKAFSNNEKYALLVGINNYINPEIPKIKGAVNDVLAFKKVLLEKFNFKEENITVLLDKQATYDAILESFKQLIKYSEQGPAFFYFAGAGSILEEEGDDNRTLSESIVSVDGRNDGVYDIYLEDLSSLSSNRNLITVIDVNWHHGYSRNAKSDKRKRPISRNIFPEHLKRIINISENYKDYEFTKIGDMTIYPHSTLTYNIINESKVELSYNKINETELELPSFENPKKSIYHGRLTHAMVKVFIENDINNMTYSKLIESISKLIPKTVYERYKQDKTIFFSNLKLVDKVVQNLKTIENLQVINKAIFLLQRLIEQRNDVYPEGYLNLGIAYASKGDYDNGIKFTERAIVQQGNSYPEASYYLGKFLFERGKEFARAVGILREVIKYEPNNNAAYYYLGQSIRSLIETETLVEAERSLRTYLENGAQIGHEKNVQEFLNSIEKQKQSIKV
jgi:tetratricopeptide (TPR) repeat protein